MKPMIKYRGGKSKEIPNIMWHIPRFSGRYVEPFFGGGALFFYLEPRQAIINDINTKLISFYRGVRDNYDKLREELNEVEAIYVKNRKDFERLKSISPDSRVVDNNEELYYRMRDMFNGISEKKYSDALLYFFINKTAYSGMLRYNSRGEFNVPYGRYAHLNTECVSRSHSLLLQRAEVYDKDYSAVFDVCETDDFIFLDPPYDCVFSDYGNELYRDGFSEEDHRNLALDFANLPCKALMIIGRTPLTKELYSGYIIDDYEKKYAVNIRNRFKSEARHLIVANYRKSWGMGLSSTGTYENIMQAETAQLRLFEAEEPYGTNK